jgi:hypothetical protein
MVKNARDGTTSKHVMIEVSIKVVQQCEVLAKGGRSVCREDLGDDKIYTGMNISGFLVES